ncbi:probable cation-transporting ATPase W08D2.5 isoform X3 [Mya arenaria]|nr:probable cation-transporting ATPase W08D2.5 isoform X3 [Mya arenaria]
MASIIKLAETVAGGCFHRYVVSLNDLFLNGQLYYTLRMVVLYSKHITVGRTHAYHRLHKVPPPVRLTNLAPVLSLIFQMAIIIAVQVFFFIIIKREPWYIEYVDDPEEDYDFMSYEKTTVYISSSYQYIILAIVFSKGKPYRKSMFTNYFFLVNLFICIGLTAWINIHPTDPVAEFFKLLLPPRFPYRLLFLGVAGVNLLLCILLEAMLCINAVTTNELNIYCI